MPRFITSRGTYVIPGHEIGGETDSPELMDISPRDGQISRRHRDRTACNKMYVFFTVQVRLRKFPD